MDILTVDMETYYDKEYSLSKLTTEAYVRDPRFEVILVSVKVNDDEPVVYLGDDVAGFLAQFDWSRSAGLAHHAAFDGAILSWHYGIKPKLWLDTVSMARPQYMLTCGVSLDALTQRLNLGQKGTAVLNALGKRKADFTQQELEDYGAYCKQDVNLTYKLFNHLAGDTEKRELAVIDQTIRMFTEPSFVLDKDILREHLTDVQTKKANLLSQITADKDALMSNDKFAEVLRGLGVDPPTKISLKTGKPSYAFAKTDPGMKELQEHDDPMVQAVVAARLGVKSTLEETRTQNFLAIAERGPLPIMLKYWGAHCVPGDTEVLTRSGWERLDAWSGGEIAQYELDSGAVRFDEASRFVGPIASEWVRSTARYMPIDMTPGHKLPILQHRSFKPATLQAADLIDRGSSYVPTSGKLSSIGNITPEQMRVLCMVQADGSYEASTAAGCRLTIFVKKSRKIERARAILRAASVPFEEQTYPSHPGFVRFIVKHRDRPHWLGPERKVYGSWLLDSTPEAREALLSELQHWDGWVQHGQVQYSTSVLANAEWVQIVAHLTGRGGAISEKHRAGRSTNYNVCIRQRAHCMVRRADVAVVAEEKVTYCASTKTGYWLARSKGHVFVTGNTGRFSGDDGMNLQNLPRGGRLRDALLASPGHVVIVSDSAQIEARIVAWLAGQDDLVEAFFNGRDVYAEFASEVYGRLITKETDPLERFIGKTCIAEGTLLLTDSGLKPIEAITLSDKLWDGEQWVEHEGLLHKGIKPVARSLPMTPDHDVWCGKAGWKQAQLLEHDASTLSQALDFAAESLPSLGTSWACEGDLASFLSLVAAEETNTRSTPVTSKPASDLFLSLKNVYDVANAGPKHRFFILTERGFLCVSNCILGLGYGMGAKKLRATLASGATGPVVHISQQEAERIISVYRKKNHKIKQLWYNTHNMLTQMVSGGTAVPLTKGILGNVDTLSLPGGGSLRYPNLRGSEDGFLYDARKKPVKIYGGKCVENIVQHLAQVTIKEHMSIIRRKYRVVLQVHDEIVCMVPEAQAEEAKAFIRAVMSQPPSWGPDIPIACEIDFGRSYGDAK